MRHRIFGLLIVALLVTPAGAVAAPQAAGDYVIVSLKNKPLASYTGGVAGLKATKPARGKLDTSKPAYRAYERFLANEHANYRAFIKKNAPAAKVVREYKVVLNGFALKLNGTDPAVLSRSSGVKSVGKSWLYQPTMNESVDLIEAAAGWTATGGRADAGEGVNIGIIDSGIDESHDFFECKETIEHEVYASGVAGDPTNLLANEHGTHVSGTAAGCLITLTEGPITGDISGVAPGAALFDYNVFPGYGAGFVAFGGSAFSHDIAAAIEDAVTDGIDVINMSLGGSIQGPHDYLAEASNAAVDAGVVVATSAGNSGPGGGTIGSPGNAMNVIASGATTNTHYIGVDVVTGFGTFGAAVGDFDPFADAPVTDVPFVRWGPDGADLACNGGAAPTSDLTGDVVLIKRGVCTFAEKVANAATEGAIGVVVYNSVAGDPIAMGGTGTIPAVMVSDVDGVTIAAGLPSTVTIDGSNPVEVVTTNGDIIAGFSSRGPGSFLNNVKPDVVAPGVNIYSSVFDNEWAMFQGTSMASPHTAGAAALLIDAYGVGELSPADVKSLLGNNADRNVWAAAPGGATVGVLARGGGRINIDRALDAEATFSPMSLSFGRHNGSRQVNVSIEVTVTNWAGSSTEFSISESDAKLSLSEDSLTIAAGQSDTFTVSLSARGVWSGDGDVTVSGGGHTYLIPLWYSTGNVSK
jgi:minor extracellular serine protease Vpr